MDNQWHGTLKQRMGVVSSRWYLHPLYDAVFLPGERQACFARAAGVSPEPNLEGTLLSGPRDVRAGSNGRNALCAVWVCGAADSIQGHHRSHRCLCALPRSDTRSLGPRHRRYGSSRGYASSGEGLTFTGFLQPRELPAWLAEIGCLVVPSRFEPWGVVIAEAAASGMPIIATDACGAGTAPRARLRERKDRRDGERRVARGVSGVRFVRSPTAGGLRWEMSAGSSQASIRPLAGRTRSSARLPASSERLRNDATA